MNYAIEIRNLTKNYGSFKAVDNLNIHVPEGKIYGFLGRNGAGKTTTIRMIMGLIRPDKGEIMVYGKDVCKNRLWAARNMGAIVEIPGFYENLPARANLDITAEMYGINKKRIEEVLEIVGLSDVGNKKMRDFSLGMKQRLGIANALVHSPKILILDEPTNGLDPAGIKEMRDFLRKLSEEDGITVMISSHILSEIQLLADYVGIIDKGRLIEETDIETVKTAEQSCVLLEVDNPKAAEEMLKRMKIRYESEEGRIKIFCKKEINYLVNKNLVEGGIKVFNLSSNSQSLEERFLSVTGGQSIA
ncbi:MAG TPA: ABC transporter ATP-binding protein [Clostridia bacterium]|nr:ABC transporter ATP-binding protein [Clostridia bacterium]